MTKRQRPADLYMRILQLSKAMRNGDQLKVLDPLEERILEIIVSSRQKNERLSVKDLMANSDLGSPSTLHSRLKSMRKKGWIKLEDTEDARRKQLDLTTETLKHFDTFSRMMLREFKKWNKSG